MKKILLSILIAAILSPAASLAQTGERLSLTITPPFVDLGIGKGEYWQSSLKVVNTNSAALTLYATAMNFASNGEDGHADLSPAPEGASVLANWIDLPDEPVIIPPGESREIIYGVKVPKDAPPGGHYAAILVGTAPLDGKQESGSVMKISSYVSSLLFLKIGGDVVEQGQIREFRASETVYDEPRADFQFRFENFGNVHLHPEGMIEIYDMFGRKRDQIPVNQGTEFGNVLPKSVRKFELAWSPQAKLTDIGRHTAILTLAYGDNARQNVSRAVIFWIIPVRPLLAALGIIVFLFMFIAWMIRRHVRKAISGVTREISPEEARKFSSDGVIDLRKKK